MQYRLLMRLKQKLRIGIEALTCLGELYPVFITQEKCGSKLLLNKLDVAAYTWYGDVELLGSLAEA